jgi:three-Cys-motif partner protein
VLSWLEYTHEAWLKGPKESEKTLGVEFHEDAIVLSGETGTKLKCDIIGEYYPIWWSITSGNESRNFGNPTAIIEMNAGTGLDYIEDTGEEILGSSGHALRLKFNGLNTENLQLVLVESDAECFRHLKAVIAERWPQVNIEQAISPPPLNKTKICLVRDNPADAIARIEMIPLGNSLFFFDPLLYTPWSDLERVASGRIRKYYQTRTEFIVFLFTSDWFKGRGSLDLHPLPKTNLEGTWSEDERNTVHKVDQLFGQTTWRAAVLSGDNEEQRMGRLVAEYRRRLHKWFRYVLPLPFAPKENQLYHLFMCSNYEAGVEITRRFYTKFTGNPSQGFDSSTAFERFKQLHSDLTSGLNRRERPLEWKFLNAVLKRHDEGLCDMRCIDLVRLAPDYKKRLDLFRWVEANHYLRRIPQMTDAWQDPPILSKVDWTVVKDKFGVTPPPELKPLLPNHR